MAEIMGLPDAYHRTSPNCMCAECQFDFASWRLRMPEVTINPEGYVAEPDATKSVGGAGCRSLDLDQPAPQANAEPAIWDLVMADMAARDKVGLERYGVRLQPHNGRDALKDAYAEALDLCVYLRQAIYERDQSLAKRSAGDSGSDALLGWVKVAVEQPPPHKRCMVLGTNGVVFMAIPYYDFHTSWWGLITSPLTGKETGLRSTMRDTDEWRPV